MAKKNALGFAKETPRSVWKKGEAYIKLSRDQKTALIRFDEDEKYKFPASLFPDLPKITDLDLDNSYFVELVLNENGDVDRVNSIRPIKWMAWKMKLVDMTHPNGDKELPVAPYTYETNYDGKKGIEEAFYGFYECVEDNEFKGVLFPKKYYYAFIPRGDGFTTLPPYGDRATRIPTLADDFTLLETFEENIEWPDDGNVLPEILARALDAGVIVETASHSKYLGYVGDVMESKSIIKAEKPAKHQKPEEPETDNFDDDDDF